MTTPEEITDALTNKYREYINSQSIYYVMNMIELHRKHHDLDLNDLSENEKKVLTDLLLDFDSIGKKDLDFEDIRNSKG